MEMTMKNLLVLLTLAFALVFSGCGPSKAEVSLALAIADVKTEAVKAKDEAANAKTEAAKAKDEAAAAKTAADEIKNIVVPFAQRECVFYTKKKAEEAKVAAAALDCKKAVAAKTAASALAQEWNNLPEATQAADEANTAVNAVCDEGGTLLADAGAPPADSDAGAPPPPVDAGATPPASATATVDGGAPPPPPAKDPGGDCLPPKCVRKK